MKNFYISKIINPKGLKKDEYDAIIIGAGIGGLVCGCYLAKAGLKVLIVEKHYKVGGYCTSFERGSFRFNSAVHSLTTCKKGSILDNTFDELGVYKFIEIARSCYPDILITPDVTIHIHNNVNLTIDEIQKAFPNEKENIYNFFDLLNNKTTLQLFSNLKNQTFKEFLDKEFNDYKLKSLLKALLGYIGTPSSLIPAFTAIMMYKEFIMDGRYFVKGGIQNLSDALFTIFKKMGGNSLLSTMVEKIIVKNKVAKGIVINKNNFIESKYIISNCDMKHTYLKLIGIPHLDAKFVSSLKRRLTSSSAFLVYLGLNSKLEEINDKFYSLWYLTDYDIDSQYLKILNKKIFYTPKSILCCCPSFSDPSLAPTNGSTLLIYVRAAYNSEPEFWKNIKKSLSTLLIKKVENIIPSLSKKIVIKEIATPNTFYKYTFNSEGATNGWAPTISHLQELGEQITPIKKLFFVGHWVAFPPVQGGVDTAIYTGKKIARSILLMK